MIIEYLFSLWIPFFFFFFVVNFLGKSDVYFNYVLGHLFRRNDRGKSKTFLGIRLIELMGQISAYGCSHSFT